MIFRHTLILLFAALVWCHPLSAQQKANYITNREPLRPNPYIELPLGSIKARGWLKEQLQRMRDGATGRLDELYPEVMGERNGWLGGDGDVWERGPYWLDGLVPLAYLLDDDELKAKAREWVEWSIENQDESGYFGPPEQLTEPKREPGLQRNKPLDWWPKMVMLKVLKQYYSATGDERIIELMTNYFRYQLKTLPEKKLNHWSWWGAQRGAENLLVVYWLYNITGDQFLLDLAEIIHEQTVDWTGMFQQGHLFRGYFKVHGVNLAQGMKAPLIYYQHHPERQYYDAVKKGLKELRQYHGQPQGLYGADEWLHGTNPVNGSELCSAVEMMYSLEHMFRITGDIAFADQVERIAFNALPTQTTDDFMARQYFQQPNQVMISRTSRDFITAYDGTGQLFGLFTGYPCCTANMHQGWPKFTQNLWAATPDGGVAAMLYAPSAVEIKVGNQVPVTITENTNYPFSERLKFQVETKKAVKFPFHLRIPAWCKDPVITVNGKRVNLEERDGMAVVNRLWNNGDELELELPMHIERSRWHKNSVAIERGPLVYALKIKEQWKEVPAHDRYKSYYEVKPLSPWNYGIINTQFKWLPGRKTESLLTPWNYGTKKLPTELLNADFQVIKQQTVSAYPWNPENAPISIKVPAKRIPNWQLYQGGAGPLPYSIQRHTAKLPEEEITLIPYGCTTLRIAEFPEVK